MRYPGMLALLLVPVLAGTGLAHGVDTTVDQVRAVVVTVTHEDGSPVADESYEILPPGGSPAFASGRTDRVGRVVFAPDRAGEWVVRVVVADGHGAVRTVQVDADMLTTAAGPAVAANRPWQMVTGVAVLFGAFGLVALVQARRR